MADDSIDHKNGIIDVYRLLPKTGDAVTVINCGSHFEVRHQRVEVQLVPPAYLTDEDIECLAEGRITFN